VSPENVIVCGHICCPDPTSTKDLHFHRVEPNDCDECRDAAIRIDLGPKSEPDR
jgi:hypothetical protein